jgi:hypothetical protein
VNEDNEPDWLAELAKGGEALRRQIEALVQAAEQFAAGGPARPLARRITRAVDAGMSELLSATESPVVRDANVQGLAAKVSVIAGVGTVTTSGSVVLAPLRASGQFTIEDPPSGQAERGFGQLLALVLVAIMTARLLAVPGPDQAAVGYDLTVLGDALTIAWIIWNWNQNK